MKEITEKAESNQSFVTNSHNYKNISSSSFYHGFKNNENFLVSNLKNMQHLIIILILKRNY